MVLTASDEDLEWRDFCVRVADRVIVVARPDHPPTRSVIGLPANGPRYGGYSSSLGGNGLRTTPSIPYRCTSSIPPKRLMTASGRLPPGCWVVQWDWCCLEGEHVRCADLGVIEVLQEAKIHVDRIAGTSAGALLGALYAAGYDANELDAVIYEEFVRHNPHGDYTFPRYSLTRGARPRPGSSGISATLSSRSCRASSAAQCRPVATRADHPPPRVHRGRRHGLPAPTGAVLAISHRQRAPCGRRSHGQRPSGHPGRSARGNHCGCRRESGSDDPGQRARDAEDPRHHDASDARGAAISPRSVTGLAPTWSSDPRADA